MRASGVAWLCLACLCGAPASARGAETLHETRRVAGPLKPIEIRVTIGNVEIHADERDDLLIDVERIAPDARGLTRLPFSIADTEDLVIIDLSQADQTVDPALLSHVVLRLPRDSVVRWLRVGTGRVSVTGLHGQLQAHVTRGDVSASQVGGIIRIETETGDIRLSDATLQPDGLIRCRAFRGSVDVMLDATPVNARVMLHTLRGSIDTDLALTPREGFGRRLLEGLFGTGQPLLSVDVVQGGIRLSVASSHVLPPRQ